MDIHGSLAPSNPELSASLIAAARDGEFARIVLQAAQRIDDVAEVFVYSVANDGRPKAICSSGGLCNSAECAENYAQSYYRFDPAMQRLASVSRHSGFADQITTASIARADYRAFCFEQQNFADKVCFGWRSDKETTVIAFYRNRERDVQPLASLADHSLAALASASALRARRDTVSLVERLERRLALCYSTLTQRELQIIARTLAGETADSTARELDLSLGTVLTYRQRGYQRFGYSRANDFLSQLLD